MPKQDLFDLLSRIQADPALREKFRNAPDLNSAQAIAREAGFDVSKSDWIEHRGQQEFEISDADLEVIAGGKNQNHTQVSCDKKCPHQAPVS
jgi:predicted ribosomally synthesized peptide with nif11-like leader